MKPILTSEHKDFGEAWDYFEESALKHLPPELALASVSAFVTGACSVMALVNRALHSEDRGDRERAILLHTLDREVAALHQGTMEELINVRDALVRSMPTMGGKQ